MKQKLKLFIAASLLFLGYLCNNQVAFAAEADSTSVTAVTPQSKTDSNTSAVAADSGSKSAATVADTSADEAVNDRYSGYAWLDVMLWLVYILFTFGFLAAIVLPFLKVSNPDKLKQSFIISGVLLLVFVICYFVSSGTVGPVEQRFGITSGGSKFLSASLITFYIMAVGSVVLVVYSEIVRIFK